MERIKRDPVPPATGGLSSHSQLRAGRVAANSGEHTLRYGLMREVLLTYLSPVLVDSVLTRSLEARKLTASSLDAAELAELASDVMVGLRLFVPEERLSTLMLALADVLESHT